MNTLRRLAILAAAASVLALGCTTRGHPMYAVNSAPIAPKSGKALSSAEISQAIVKAGGGVGWTIVPEGPGRLTGRYTAGAGKHVAVVSIDHDTKVYNIKYLDSQGLNAEPAESKIHRTYNDWVQALDRAISSQLSTM